MVANKPDLVFVLRRQRNPTPSPHTSDVVRLTDCVMCCFVTAGRVQKSCNHESVAPQIRVSKRRDHRYAQPKGEALPEMGWGLLPLKVMLLYV